VTQEELDRARRTFLRNGERALTPRKDIALELSEWIAAADWRLLFIHRDRVARVTVEDVMHVARLTQADQTHHRAVPAQQEVVRTKIPQTPSVADLVKDTRAARRHAGERRPHPENIEKASSASAAGSVKVALLQRRRARNRGTRPDAAASATRSR